MAKPVPLKPGSSEGQQIVSTSVASTFIEPKTADNPQQNSDTRPYFPHLALRCSVCAAEVGGVMDLIWHTDSNHCVLRPRIFANHKKSSQQITTRSQETDSSKTKDVVVVDLSLPDQDVFEGLKVAYGCGQCGHRLPTMLALQYHKDSIHGAQNGTNRFTRPSLPSLQPFYGQNNGNTNLLLLDENGQEHCSLSPLTMALTGEEWTNDDTDTLDVMASIDLLMPSSEKPNVTKMNEKRVYTGFECSVCALEVRSRSALSVHMRTHSVAVNPGDTSHNEIVQPRLTPEMGNSKQSMQLRTRKPRINAIKRAFFYCRVCGAGQKSQKALQEHSSLHQRPSDNRYPCPTCSPKVDRSYATFQQLQRHIGFVHPKEIFPCSYCDRTFGRRKNLLNHLIRHTGQRDYVCSYESCGKRFGRKDKLERHLKTHEISNSFSKISSSW